MSVFMMLIFSIATFFEKVEAITHHFVIFFYRTEVKIYDGTNSANHDSI